MGFSEKEIRKKIPGRAFREGVGCLRIGECDLHRHQTQLPGGLFPHRWALPAGGSDPKGSPQKNPAVRLCAASQRAGTAVAECRAVWRGYRQRNRLEAVVQFFPAHQYSQAGGGLLRSVLRSGDPADL